MTCKIKVFLLFMTIYYGSHQQSQFAESKNILVYGAVGTHSIRLSMWPMMEALTERGHNVTFLSGLENFENPKKKTKVISYTPKKWKESLGPWEEHMKFYDLRKNQQVHWAWMDVRPFGISCCEILYSDPEFVQFINTSQFDLVIVEMLVNECAYGLVHKWNAKLIIYSTTSVIPHFPDAHGLPDESASITDIIFGFPSGDKMSFTQRLTNVMYPLYFSITRDWFYFPQMEAVSKKGLGIDDLPSFKEIEKNASLLMLTSHFSLDYPRSFPPYLVPVGGGVVTKEKKPLPKEMDDFLKSAKSGFIYISFGTVAEFTNFEDKAQIEFITALEKFPEIKFLWKLSTDITVKKLPENVFVAKWVPQQTVLDHPNIKAFITHGGMGSVTEAVHFSVPLICIPILAEQDTNSQLIAERGAGILLEILTLKHPEMEHAISEILHNAKYRQGMTRLTSIFKDRQTPPLENAIWWIEYVLRHDNTNEYLRPPSINLPWWKKRNLDIWILTSAFIILLPTAALLILFKLAAALICKSSDGSGSGAKSKKRLKRD